MLNLLSDITILDFTQLLPGPYCSQLLADMGARVIKVEQTGTGDYARLIPYLFNSVNRNKKSIKLNIKSQTGRDILEKLVKSADVFMEGARPGVAERLKIDYKRLSKINPGLIYCSISGYGQKGPYRNLPGHDLNYQAVSGMLSCFVDENENSIHPKLPIADMTAGLFATIGILTALHGKTNSSLGCYIDVSMLDGLLSFLSIPLGRYFHGINKTIYDPGYRIFKTSDDKYLTLGVYFEDWFWQRLCKTFKLPELSSLKAEERKKRSPELIKILSDIFKTKPLEHWLEILTEADVPVSPVNSFKETVQDPQVLCRKILDKNKEGGEPSIKGIMCPLNFSTGDYTSNPPPDLGQDTFDILLQAGFSKDEIETFKKENII